jgi:branched-subunit amino acid transport protein
MMAFTAALFSGRPEAGQFTDARGVIDGLHQYVGRMPATIFAVALLDASIIGAAAVSLSTAYAIGDVFGIRHSLHRSVADAKGFYLVYFGIVVLAAALVLMPGSPLGLLTEAVQTLAGVLLPSATVFLLLLCNDRAVLGPWVNSGRLNFFTGTVVAALVVLSIILTAATVYPDLSGETIVAMLIAGASASALGYAVIRFMQRRENMGQQQAKDNGDAVVAREQWRMPPLDMLPAPRLSFSTRVWMGALRGYLAIAVGLVIVKVVQMALH